MFGRKSSGDFLHLHPVISIMCEKEYEPPDRTYRAGQSLTMAKAIIGVLSLGVFWAFASSIFQPMEDRIMSHTTENASTTGIEWTGEFFWNFPFIVVGVAILGTIAFSVFQRRGV